MDIIDKLLLGPVIQEELFWDISKDRFRIHFDYFIEINPKAILSNLSFWFFFLKI